MKSFFSPFLASLLIVSACPAFATTRISVSGARTATPKLRVTTTYSGIKKMSFYGKGMAPVEIVRKQMKRVSDEPKKYEVSSEISQQLLTEQGDLDSNLRLIIWPKNGTISSIRYSPGEIPTNWANLEEGFSVYLSWDTIRGRGVLRIWTSHRVPYMSLMVPVTGDRNRKEMYYFYNKRLLKEILEQPSLLKDKIDAVVKNKAEPFSDRSEERGFLTEILLPEGVGRENVAHLNFFAPIRHVFKLENTTTDNLKVKLRAGKTGRASILKDILYASSVGLNKSRIHQTTEKTRKSAQSGSTTSLGSGEAEMGKLSSTAIKRLFFSSSFESVEETRNRVIEKWNERKRKLEESKLDEQASTNPSESKRAKGEAPDLETGESPQENENEESPSDDWTDLGAASPDVILQALPSEQGSYYKIEADGNCLARAIFVASGFHDFASSETVSGERMRTEMRAVLLDAANYPEAGDNRLILEAVSRDLITFLTGRDRTVISFRRDAMERILADEEIVKRTEPLHASLEILSQATGQTDGALEQLVNRLVTQPDRRVLRDYIEGELSRDGRWESENIAVALAIHFKRKVVIFNVNSGFSADLEGGGPDFQGQGEPIFLRFSGGNHYDAFLSQPVLPPPPVEVPLASQDETIRKAEIGEIDKTGEPAAKRLHMEQRADSDRFLEEGEIDPTQLDKSVLYRSYLIRLEQVSSDQFKTFSKSHQIHALYALAQEQSELARREKSPKADKAAFERWSEIMKSEAFYYLSAKRRTEVRFRIASLGNFLNKYSEESYKQWNAVIQSEGFAHVPGGVQATALFNRAFKFNFMQGTREVRAQYWQDVLDHKAFKLLISKHRVLVRFNIAESYGGDDRKRHLKLWRDVEDSSGFKELTNPQQYRVLGDIGWLKANLGS